MKEKAIVAVGAVLVLFVVAGVVGTAIATTPPGGIDLQQAKGEVDIIVVTPGAVDSMQLVTPSGTRSFVMSRESMVAGSRLTIRSKDTLYEYFEENNVTVPTTTGEGGYIRITSPEDVPLRDLTLQNDDLTQDTSYDRRSAYLACLYNPSRGFEVSGTSFPSNVSVPCHAPVLAQFDEIQAGTSKELGNDTVTTPLILEEGEYRLVGSVGGDCEVIRRVSVSATVALGESLSNVFGGTSVTGTCAWSEIGVKSLPRFAYLIALLVVSIGVAVVAYRRF